MKRVLIVSGGIIGDRDFLRKRLSMADAPVIICADGGLRHLVGMNVVPAFIMGDMDSVSPDLVDFFARRGSLIKKCSARKDETDTQLAMELALSMNPEEIWILGALGGRIDHSLANIHLLMKAERSGVGATIMDESCDISLVSGKREVHGNVGDTVSFIPLTMEVSGITLKGFEYELDDSLMEIGFPYGISNRLKERTGFIEISSGYLIMIRQYGV